MRPVGGPSAATHSSGMDQRPDARAQAVAAIAAALEDAGADDPQHLAEVAFDVLKPKHYGWWSKLGACFTPSWSSPVGSDAEPLFSFACRHPSPGKAKAA